MRGLVSSDGFKVFNVCIVLFVFYWSAYKNCKNPPPESVTLVHPNPVEEHYRKLTIHEIKVLEINANLMANDFRIRKINAKEEVEFHNKGN